MLLLHIGAFRLDVDSERNTLWHRLTPKARILCVVLLVFAIALTPNGRWWTWLIYGIGLVSLTLVSRVTFPVLLRRVSVEFIFLAIALIGTLFQEKGEVLWQWGWLQITVEGLKVLGSVSLKALLSLWVLNILVLTTAISALLHGLLALRVPALLVAIMASMYRYIPVLVNEASTMRRAAQSRNLMSRSRWQRVVVGHIIGSLFIRTYERGDRVHQAMLARGYTGMPTPPARLPVAHRVDSLAITLTALLTLAGQMIYL